MQEYLSDAVVLAREPRGDADIRLTLFTQKFGKLSAKVKSARKITSKLSPHLTEGNLAKVRVVEHGGLQLVDALKISRLSFSPQELRSLYEVLPDAEPDQRIWSEITSGNLKWNTILRYLGWDPAQAECVVCGNKPKTFKIPTQEFLCQVHENNSAGLHFEAQ